VPLPDDSEIADDVKAQWTYLGDPELAEKRKELL
jgi:hypothetical protein